LPVFLPLFRARLAFLPTFAWRRIAGGSGLLWIYAFRIVRLTLMRSARAERILIKRYAEKLEGNNLFQPFQIARPNRP
jgi:hypothetical protein